MYGEGKEGVIIACMTLALRPWTLAFLQCRDGIGRGFTDQAGIDCTREGGGARCVVGF